MSKGSGFGVHGTRCMCPSYLVFVVVLFMGGAAHAADPGKPLFNGKSLDGWKVTDYAGRGEVHVKDGQIILPFGDMLTGVTYQKKTPKSNYEITLEAQRVDGADFFCCLTFPVGDEFCSLILGGWGGTIVGLSSIDGLDASLNQTTCYKAFEDGKWYAIRLRVTDAKIKAWIGKEQYIAIGREGIEFSVRLEVEESRPLGIAAYQSTAAIRNLRLRPVEQKKDAASQNAATQPKQPAKEKLKP